MRACSHLFRNPFSISALGLLVLTGTIYADSARAQQKSVELELVLAVDASASVDPAEFELQWRGLADAFVHRDVVDAISNAGSKGIAVTVVQWSGEGQYTVVVDWTLVYDADSAQTFSRRIATVQRLLSGFTDIAGAIRFSVNQINANGYSGERQLVDISGDGSSTGSNPAIARDWAVSKGITINGLVIQDDDPDLYELGLNDYYATRVIGGRDAFLIVAMDFDDFARAIREKLIREIIGPRIAQPGSPTHPPNGHLAANVSAFAPSGL